MLFLHLFLFFLVVLTPHQNEAKPTCNWDCELKLLNKCEKELLQQGTTPDEETIYIDEYYDGKFEKCIDQKLGV